MGLKRPLPRGEAGLKREVRRREAPRRGPCPRLASPQDDVRRARVVGPLRAGSGGGSDPPAAAEGDTIRSSRERGAALPPPEGGETEEGPGRAVGAPPEAVCT